MQPMTEVLLLSEKLQRLWLQRMIYSVESVEHKPVVMFKA